MTGLFVAIDTGDMARAEELVGSLKDLPLHFKLGLEFFTANGPAGVAKIKARAPQKKIFLDLKLHDIPNTVAGAVKSASTLGVDFLTIHATGGADMMAAAQAAAGGIITLLAVTVLTSAQAAPDDVLTLAKSAEGAGIPGVICSPHEIALLKKQTGLRLVTPGIRPIGAAAGDQKRVMTPEEAAQAGADYIVVGRPVTGASDPVAAARDILGALDTGCAMSGRTSLAS